VTVSRFKQKVTAVYILYGECVQTSVTIYVICTDLIQSVRSVSCQLCSILNCTVVIQLNCCMSRFLCSAELCVEIATVPDNVPQEVLCGNVVNFNHIITSVVI